MSSNTTIFLAPTTVSLRALCGSSHESWTCASKLHGEKHDILHARLEIALAVRRHGHWHLVEQVQCHRYIVRPETPQRVLVGAHLPQVDPQAIQIVHAAEVTALDQGPQPLDRGVEDQQVTREDRQLAFRRGAGDRLGVRCRQGKRLLHETRLPRLEAREREAGMRRRRRRDHDRVHPCEQVLEFRRDVDGRELAHEPLARRRIDVAYGREFALRQRGGGTDVVLAPRPGADHAELEPLHR
jgi:hypothetical protein